MKNLICALSIHSVLILSSIAYSYPTDRNFINFPTAGGRIAAKQFQLPSIKSTLLRIQGRPRGTTGKDTITGSIYTQYFLVTPDGKFTRIRKPEELGKLFTRLSMDKLVPVERDYILRDIVTIDWDTNDYVHQVYPVGKPSRGEAKSLRFNAVLGPMDPPLGSIEVSATKLGQLTVKPIELK